MNKTNIICADISYADYDKPCVLQYNHINPLSCVKKKGKFPTSYIIHQTGKIKTKTDFHLFKITSRQ